MSKDRSGRSLFAARRRPMFSSHLRSRSGTEPGNRPGVAGRGAAVLLSLIIVQFFQQVFAGLEFDTGAGGDHAIFTRAGIASETFGLLPGAEGTEALQNDRVTVLQGLGDDVQTGIDNIV